MRFQEEPTKGDFRTLSNIKVEDLKHLKAPSYVFPRTLEYANGN